MLNKKQTGYSLLFLIVFPLSLGAQLNTLEQENQKADKAFLKWKLADTEHVSSSLRKALTPSFRSLLVEEASLPFGTTIAESTLNKRASDVMDSFLRKIGPKAAKNISKPELKTLIDEIIKPEYVFERGLTSSYRLDKLYNEMMDTLAERRTPAGTTLKDWALRFLLSESVFIALTALERLKLHNNKFNALTPREQEQILEPVVALVAHRFIGNLEAVRHQYQLVLPDRIEDAIKYKIRRFLAEKFIRR